MPVAEAPIGRGPSQDYDAILVRIKKVVLPGISWVEAQTAAMEIDGGFEIFDIPESTGSSLDGHDLAVQPFGNPVGYGVFAVG